MVYAVTDGTQHNRWFLSTILARCGACVNIYYHCVIEHNSVNILQSYLCVHFTSTPRVTGDGKMQKQRFFFLVYLVRCQKNTNEASDKPVSVPVISTCAQSIGINI